MKITKSDLQKIISAEVKKVLSAPLKMHLDTQMDYIQGAQAWSVENCLGRSLEEIEKYILTQIKPSFQNKGIDIVIFDLFDGSANHSHPYEVNGEVQQFVYSFSKKRMLTNKEADALY